MSLKIALVIDKFDPRMGGAERYARDLSSWLIDKGHEVHVFCRKGRSGGSGVIIRRVPCLSYPKSLRLLTFVIRTRMMIAREEFDVVHALGYNTGATVLGPHTGVEESWIEGDRRSYETGMQRIFSRITRALSPREYLIGRLQQRQYREPGVRAIVAISDMVKEDMIKYRGVDPGRITVVYNGVDTVRFSPNNGTNRREETRYGLGVPPDELLILMVTNNFRLKGVLCAIRALPRLDDRIGRPCRLFVVGRGDPGPYLREAEKSGVAGRVVFLEHVQDLAPLYAAADLLLHPTFYDSCALVVIEAIASGLPVVTTAKNGAAGLISSPDLGLVVDDPRDTETLADAVSRYASEEARRNARAAALEAHGGLSDEVNFSRILDIYQRAALADRRHGTAQTTEG